MSHAELLNEAKRLSVSERLELIDRLIESVDAEVPQSIPSELEAELGRRYQAHLANPTEGEPWEVTRERIHRSLPISAISI